MVKEDDVEIGKFVNYLNITHKDTYSPFVYGECDSNFKDISIFSGNNKICDINEGHWSPNFKLTDLIALHCRRINQYQAMENLKKVKKNATNIYFRYNHWTFDTCIGKDYGNSTNV